MNTHSNSALAQHAKLKVVPRTIRETFEMLSEINSEGSLETQLSALDWTGVTTHQVYGAFLDRLPESWSVVRHFSKVDPLRHALACLKSAEFQGRVIELILHAYPEKRRLIHVHVPKTAGVDLREQLVRKYPHIHDSQTAQDFGTAPLHRHLSDFSRQVQRSDTIFVTGHIPLKWYITCRLCRHGDKIFSVLRHPRDSLLSLLNYYLQRIRECPSCTESNTRSYAKFLGVTEFPKVMSADEQRQLAKQMLYKEEMMKPNFLTHMLGEGTRDSALELIVRSNIELIPLKEYNNYMMQEWGIESTTSS